MSADLSSHEQRQDAIIPQFAPFGKCGLLTTALESAVRRRPGDRLSHPICDYFNKGKKIVQRLLNVARWRIEQRRSMLLPCPTDVHALPCCATARAPHGRALPSIRVMALPHIAAAMDRGKGWPCGTRLGTLRMAGQRAAVKKESTAHRDNATSMGDRRTTEDQIQIEIEIESYVAYALIVIARQRRECALRGYGRAMSRFAAPCILAFITEHLGVR